MRVTSFRLPLDVHEFLRSEAEKQERTMSFVLVGVLRLWINYAKEKKKQPAQPVRGAT